MRRLGSRLATRARSIARPRWAAAWLTLAVGYGLSAGPASAQRADTTAPSGAGSTRLLVRSDSGRVAVGDSVTLWVRLRLPAGGQLAGATPEFREPLPDGIRLLRVDSLRRIPGGAVSGTLVVASFRPGTLRLPPIAVTYRAGPGAATDTAVSGPIGITVTALVPEGSGTLRDIKDIEAAPVPLRWAMTVAATGLAMLLLVLVASRVDRRRAIARRAAERAAVPAGPYDVAIARLAVIAGDWATRRDVESHYAETADVLRRYLADAHGIPALERTTPELLGELPSPLSVPLVRDAPGGLLGDADLVKFARLAPTPPAPAAVVSAAHAILSEWDSSVAAPLAPATDRDGRNTGTHDPIEPG